MLQRFAGARGGQGGARSSHESQPNARPRAQPSDLHLLATVPEDDEEPAGGHGQCMNEHLVGDPATHTGFCRDHRGKLQSVWELCEDVATDAQDGVEDEDEQVFRAAVGTVPACPQAQGQPLLGVRVDTRRSPNAGLEATFCSFILLDSRPSPVGFGVESS